MRQLLCLFIVLFLALPVRAAEFVFADAKGGVLGIWTPITGTSANAYPATAQCEWTDAYQFNKKVMWVANSDATNAITVKVVAYPEADGSSWIVPVDGATENSLAAGAGMIVNIPESIDKADVFIKSTVTDTHGTFECVPSASKREG